MFNPSEEHLDTYSFFRPDVDPEEMKKSDSKDKYLYAHCSRETELLDLNSKSAKIYLSEEYLSYEFERMELGNLGLKLGSLYKSLFDEK